MVWVALSWRWITSAFLTDIAVLVLADHLPPLASPTVTWWASVAVAAVVTIAMVVTYRGVTVASDLARWVWDASADVWESSPDTEATLSPGCTPAIDHRRRFGRDVVGVREYRGQLVAVIAVDQPGDAASGRHQVKTDSSATLPVAVVAAGLRQFDVRLDAIDSSRCGDDTSPRPPIKSAPPIVDVAPQVSSAVCGWCYGWIRSAMSPRWRPAIRWPQRSWPPSSGSPTIWADGAARPAFDRR